jgi:hypothetical protein
MVLISILSFALLVVSLRTALFLLFSHLAAFGADELLISQQGDAVDKAAGEQRFPVICLEVRLLVRCWHWLVLRVIVKLSAAFWFFATEPRW